MKLLISDLVSPDWGTYEPGVERAFRRRDVTLMTMHNVMQRTRGEWGVLIAEGVKGGDFEVSSSYSFSMFRSLLFFFYLWWSFTVLTPGPHHRLANMENVSPGNLHREILKP